MGETWAGSSPATCPEATLVADQRRASAPPDVAARCSASRHWSEDDLFARSRHRRRRRRHARADPPAAGRGGGTGRQARPRREADDEHPGRCRRDGRRRRRGERPAGGRARSTATGARRWRPRRRSTPAGSATIRMIRVFGPNAGWDIPADHWNSQRAQVSPYMDWGAHACDIIRWLTGAEATLAFAQFASYTDIPPADQSSMATYTLDNGVMVQIWLTYELPPPTLGSAMQLLIAGSDGIIELDAYGTVRLGDAGRRLGDGLRAAAVRPARRRRFDPAPGLRQPAARPDRGDRRGPRPVRQRPPGRADTTSWLEAAERSAASGESVRLSLDGPMRPNRLRELLTRGAAVDRHARPRDVADDRRGRRPHPAVRLRRVLRRVRPVRPARARRLLPRGRAARPRAR